MSEGSTTALVSKYRLALTGVVLAWVVFAAVIYVVFDGPTKGGPFGDMFGAVNALFTGLAFATLIYTAWMQREELALQREELAATREELRGQKDQMREQSETLKLQRFENTFFSLLSIHSQLVDSMRLNWQGRDYQGRDCFPQIFAMLVEQNSRHGSYQSGQELAGLDAVYRGFYASSQVRLGHYFRTLYHLVKLVKTSSIQNKRQYTSLVRAQLSSVEQALLFYNGLSQYGREKFKPLIEEFALLENMPEDGLFMLAMFKPKYLPGAFGTDGL